MIEVHGLTKFYGPRLAIEDLSFKAEKGEILGFLGPNGAGKTTTMRILTGFMPPTSGQAKIAGYNVVDESLEVRRRVGYMPESVPLYPDLTVYEYLKFMADLRHLPNAEDRVDDALELVHMEERSESYISSLSKGMRQRVGLAQALLHKPAVLILDEPTIGLDPAHIIDVRNIIQNMGQEHTILLSTHILSEAQQVCDRVLIINNGRIVAEDSPENLRARVSGVQQVSIHIRGDLDKFEDVIGRLPDIRISSRGQDGKFDLESEPGEDARPEIARTIISAGFDLLEMKPLGMSLEDIFLKLTRDEDFQTEKQTPVLEQSGEMDLEEMEEDILGEEGQDA
jgi:ABC-2 type transport system ATP-binding protein